MLLGRRIVSYKKFLHWIIRTARPLMICVSLVIIATCGISGFLVQDTRHLYTIIMTVHLLSAVLSLFPVAIVGLISTRKLRRLCKTFLRDCKRIKFKRQTIVGQMNSIIIDSEKNSYFFVTSFSNVDARSLNVFLHYQSVLGGVYCVDCT